MVKEQYRKKTRQMWFGFCGSLVCLCLRIMRLIALCKSISSSSMSVYMCVYLSMCLSVVVCVLTVCVSVYMCVYLSMCLSVVVRVLTVCVWVSVCVQLKCSSSVVTVGLVAVVTAHQSGTPVATCWLITAHDGLVSSAVYIQRASGGRDDDDDGGGGGNNSNTQVRVGMRCLHFLWDSYPR